MFRKSFHEVEYFHEVGCTGGWFKTMEWKMHFSKTSMMELKLWVTNLDNWIKFNWIKVDSAVCSVMGLNKWKYLRNSSLRLFIPCVIVSYWRTYWFYYFFQKETYKYKEWSSKKNDMNLYLESSRISTTEHFCES